tara:strand:- start:55 stop:681 length:627 start_codon:yes stop_codon:yes gene_type:complete
VYRGDGDADAEFYASWEEEIDRLHGEILPPRKNVASLGEGRWKHNLPPNEEADAQGRAVVDRMNQEDERIRRNREAYLISIWWLLAFDALNKFYEGRKTRVNIEHMQMTCDYIHKHINHPKANFDSILDFLYRQAQRILRSPFPSGQTQMFERLLLTYKRDVTAKMSQYSEMYDINMGDEMDLFVNDIFNHERPRIVEFFASDPPGTG